MITWENYEEYLVLHADGELTTTEEKALRDFVHLHPELKKEMELYESLRITPDTTLTYGNKSNLLKPVPAMKVIALGKWRTYAAAAGVVLLIGVGLSVLKFGHTDVTNKVAATIDTPKPALVQAVTPTRVAKQDVSVVVTPQQATPVVKLQSTPKPMIAKAVQNVPPVPEKQEQETIHKMAVPTPKEITAPKNIAKVQQTKEVPAYAAPEHNDNDDRSLVSMLPIDDEKKGGMESMTNVIASGFQKVNTLRDRIREKSVAISIEKKKLIFTF